LISLADADPEGWRDTLVEALPLLSGRRRELALEAVARHASRRTESLLRDLQGDDVADVRRKLLHRHAPRLFIRSFGTMSLHRGAWDGPAVSIDRRRT